MKIEQLLKQYNLTKVTDDSRIADEKTLFVYDKKMKLDGASYIKMAIKNGCKVILTNEHFDSHEIIFDDNPNLELAKYYKKISGEQVEDLIAITGTNGKTSTVWFLQNILMSLGKKVGTIGTLGYYTNDVFEGYDGFTTPTADKIHKKLNDFYNKNVDVVVMEASSHSLEIERIGACKFNIAAFTNLTEDHFDFHENFDNYFNSKIKLFKKLKSNGVAVINLDDSYGEKLANMCKSDGKPVITYGGSCGVSNCADFMYDILDFGSKNQTVEFKYKGFSKKVTVPLIGDFQIANLSCAICCCIAYGFEFKDIIGVLDFITPVVGRMEVVSQKIEAPSVVVDYAHTPDALEKALKSARKQTKEELWVVFGCGGNRDNKKRPIMGEIAKNLADKIIVTDDNPRFENADNIRSEIMEACPGAINIAGREKAIEFAIKNAKKGDTILLAGKGHENEQLINGEKFYFNDKDVAAKYL